MIRRIATAGALALSVGLLTPAAQAAPEAPAAASDALTSPAPAAPEAPVAAATGAPLALRPQKPLELAPARESTSSGVWKLLALAVVAGAGLYAWRKKHGQKAEGAPTGAKPTIDIITRKSIGIRSELVVVEVKGATMLLGVTPHSIQMVTTFGDAEGDDEGSLGFAVPTTAPVVDIKAARPPSKSERTETPLERQVLGLIRRNERRAPRRDER